MKITKRTKTRDVLPLLITVLKNAVAGFLNERALSTEQGGKK